MEIKQETDKPAPKKSRKKEKNSVDSTEKPTSKPCTEEDGAKKTKSLPVKKPDVEVPLVRPEKKKELELFWRSISADNVHRLTDKDYEAYRRWAYKRREANKVS